MKTAYIDSTVGASGDMLLGAILDLLVQEAKNNSLEIDPLAAWSSSIKDIMNHQEGGRYSLKKINKAGLEALKIDFFVEEVHADNFNDQNHSHVHYSEIKKLLTNFMETGKLKPDTYQLSIKIFDILAEAEAKAHDTAVEYVHFHEVGAYDSIMDIVGFAAAFIQSGIKKVICSHLGTGSGKVHTAHGELEVPTPAVVEIIKKHQLQTTGDNLKGECLTPTGACVLAAIVDEWQEKIDFSKLRLLGVGAGSRECSYPNVVKIGEV